MDLLAASQEAVSVVGPPPAVPKKSRRSRATARKAGTSFERLIADHLAKHVDDRVDRRPKMGAKDRGDIANLRTSHGHRIVVECKDTAKIALGPWAGEAEVERLNDDALVGMIIHKRQGKGAPGLQWVTMTVDDLIALTTGERPEDDD